MDYAQDNLKFKKPIIMKRLMSMVMVGLGLFSFQNARATLLFSDGFNYTSGNDLGYNSTTPPWTATASATANMSIGSANLTDSPLQNLGGNDLVLTSGAAAGAPAYASIGGAQNSGSIYYSFLIDCTSIPTASTYLTGLTPSTHLGLNGSGTDALDLYAKSSGTGYVLGVRTVTSSSYSTTVLAANTTYFAVLEYTFGGTAQLFVNPTPGGAQPGTASASSTPATYVTDISAVAFKAQTSTAIGNYLFDNVMVGTTWADVTPAPEPTTLALSGLGILGLSLLRRVRR